MAKTNKTIDKDLGHKRILSEAKKLRGSFVNIGVNETEGGENYPGSDVTVAEVAFWHEFGTVTSPERSFIRSTVDENRVALNDLTKKLLLEIVAGKLDTKKALEKIGFKIETLIKKKILDLNEPKNAPSTIERKGFNNPLVDSRRLWRSIAYQVMIKGAL